MPGKHRTAQETDAAAPDRGSPPEARRDYRWARAFLAVVLALYLALSAAYTHYLPPGQAPDEHAHFEYVLFLAREGRLPRYGVDDVGYESYQAPLYYTLSAVVCKLAMWAASGAPAVTERPVPSTDELLARFPKSPLVPRAQYDLALHAMGWARELSPSELAGWRAVRWFTILLGAIGIVLAWAIVLTVAPKRPWLAATAAAGIALLPMYEHICAAVGNDPPTVVVLGGVALMILVVLRDGPSPRRVAALGALLGLGMLTKDSANVGLPVAVIAVVLAVGKRREPSPSPSLIVDLGRWLASLRWRQLLARLGLMLGVAAVVGGWWYARNTILYGGPLHYPANVEKQMPWDFYLIYPEWLPRVLGLSLPMTFRNFWAGFSWTNVVLPLWWYWLLLGVSLLPVPGLVAMVADLRARRLTPLVWQVRAVWMLALLLSLLALAVTAHAMFIGLGGGSQGRYYFPALPSIGLLAAAGLARLLPWRARPALPFVAGGLMLAFNLYCLVGYVIPYYRALVG